METNALLFSSSSSSSTLPSQSAGSHAVLWPELTRDELVLRYHAQRWDWQRQFDWTSERKPIEGYPYDGLYRLYQKLFPQSGDSSSQYSPFLPPELWGVIFDYLSVNELKTCQLVSRHWANLAWKNLSRVPFRLFPYQADMHKLAYIASSDRLRPTVKALHFFIGTKGNLPGVHDNYNYITMAYRGLRRKGEWEHYEKSLTQNSNTPAAITLMGILAKLDIVKTLQITFKDFCNESMWPPAYSDRINPLEFAEARNNFKTILSCMKASRTRMLVLEDIQFCFLKMGEFLSYENLRFECLEKVDISVRMPSSEVPKVKTNRENLNGLAALLKASPNLKVLTLYRGKREEDKEIGTNNPFGGFHYPYHRYCGCNFFDDHFQDHVWSNLKELHVGGMDLWPDDLLRFLKPHSNTIRRLALYDMACRDSIEGLVEGIRNSMNRLEKFHMYGQWEVLESRHINRDYFCTIEILPIYDSQWTQLNSVKGIADAIEAYVLGLTPDLGFKFLKKWEGLFSISKMNEYYL